MDNPGTIHNIIILYFIYMQNPNIAHLTTNIVPVIDGQSYQVVEFHGDLDQAGLSLISTQINTLAENFSYEHLVFDFGDLNFINSEGIGFLMTLHSHLANRKKSLVLVAAKAHVKDVLGVIGILNVLKVFESMGEFLKNNP